MNTTDFLIACSYRTLLPSIVIENKEIQKALKKRDDKKVLKLLDTLF